MGGVKFDAEKPPLALIPPVALRATAAAFAHGAKKYGQWNFLRGMAATRLASAAMRHIEEYLDRHERDTESSVHVLGHAIASLAMLMAVEDAGTMDDDRMPAAPGPSKLQLRVGGKYRSRAGAAVFIIDRTLSNTSGWEFVGSDHCWYSATGKYWSGGDDSTDDLIEEVTE